MLVRCAVLVTLSSLIACSGATNTGFFDSESNGTDPFGGADGGTKSASSKSKDGGADGATQKADGGTTKKETTQPNTCSLTNLVVQMNACNTCSTGACCTQWKTCDGNPECVALLACAEECADDQGCIQTCVLLHEEGRPDVLAVYECQKVKCAAQCD